MQPIIQNFAYFAFWFEKRCQKIYAGFPTESERCIPSEDYYIDSPSCCHGNHFYLETKFRNIMKHLETQFEHSMFTSG